MKLFAAVLALIPALTFAGDLNISAGVGLTTTEDQQLESSNLYDLRVGYKNYFLFGNYMEPSFRKSGQTFKDVEVTGFGVGGEFPLTEKLSLVATAGYYDPELNVDPSVRNEAVYHEMKQSFGRAPFHPTAFEYTLDPDYGFTLGLDYKTAKHFSVFGGYRALKFKEFMEMWDARQQRHNLDGSEPDCGCWWQKGGTVDFSGPYLGIRGSF